MSDWMTIEEVETAIYEHYQARTEDIIRVLGRESYVRQPVVIQEVGYIQSLWAIFDRAVAEGKS